MKFTSVLVLAALLGATEGIRLYDDKKAAAAPAAAPAAEEDDDEKDPDADAKQPKKIDMKNLDK